MSSAPSVLDRYSQYEAVIGIEVHVQLLTASKIFCTCANTVSKEPNSNICPVCMGYPGTLPFLNERVVDCGILAALATNSLINRTNVFARKHYFYPDLPKNYQITQSDLPIAIDGYVPIILPDGSIKNVRLTRIHMEEDAGKSVHASASNESFVDLNRAGTPLLEIVTQPDLANGYEVKAYLRELRAMVQYLGICSGNMEDGAFRADTNISVRKKGATKLGTKCELKNINSFKFIADAIEYEIERQIELIESGGSVRQETRLWDTKNKKTTVMRSKEEAADYRYVLDPDLPLLQIDDSWIDRIKVQLPELPFAKYQRFIKELGLTSYEAEILTEDQALAQFVESTMQLHSSKLVANWILRDMLGYLKEHKIPLAEFKITPAHLAQLTRMLEAGKINARAAQEVFAECAQTGAWPEAIVKERGLEQVGSIEELESIIKELVSTSQEQVAQYKAGNERLFGYFVGQAMQKTKGKGDPKVIQELLKKHLNS